MRKTTLLALMGLISIYTKAQEELSGIINAYAAVESIDYCNNTLRVASAEGFTAGEALILIQMQGAQIDTDNDASFGDITDLGQAGLYEKGAIAAINGQDIRLENTLLHEYDLNGRVQIVSMPAYESALVTDTLTARAWDGRTGGILALEATQLTLQAPIDVSGKGFRGGSSALNYTGDCNFTSNFNDFFYAAGSIRGANKGESVSLAPEQRARGRGAQANGGGGGNDHNSGGGGGAQLSPGGDGGDNDEPSFFGCDGTSPGIGGKAIPMAAGRLFPGGGGGAGHGNNNVATDGGRGGGIIIIQVEDISSASGSFIRANGASAFTSGGDGAGGGGGGGTIALLVNNGNASGLLLEARGGRGGNANNNNSDRCFGPGGGGGGGRVLHSGGLMPSIDVSGGDSGLSINSSSCGTSANGAEPGSPGTSGTLSSLPEGSESFAPLEIVSQLEDTTACSGSSLSLPIGVNGTGLSFQWQAISGGTATNLEDGPLYAQTNSSTLIIQEVSEALNGNQYQLQINSPCDGQVLALPVRLTVVPGPSAGFTFSTNGLTVSFENNSENADGFIWSFGDGEGSMAGSPQHTFPAGGEYEVSLRAINSSCGDTAVFSAIVLLESQVMAAFEPMPATGCAPQVVTFQNNSTGTSFLWFFPGGSPESSAEGAPMVLYENAGQYDVTLIASNASGSDTLLLENAVQVGEPPEAAFEINTDELFAALINLSSGAEGYLWDFGDGSTSTAPSPTHTYDSPGDYEISLLASNGCGSDILVIPITVGIDPVAGFSLANNASGGCVPHTVYFINQATGNYDSLQWSFPGGMPATSSLSEPEVAYDSPGQYNVTLEVFRDGQLVDELTKTGFITVLPRPQPAFTYELDGLTATFTNESANATSYFWNFGDGNTSTEENPVHTYAAPGLYDVTLSASTPYCSRATGQSVFFQPSALSEKSLPEGVRLFPNPTHNSIQLQSREPDWYPVQWRLLNPQGQLLLAGTARGDESWSLNGLQAGAYWLLFYNDRGWWSAKVLKF